MATWEQVAADLGRLKAVRTVDVIAKLKDHQCQPAHALAVIRVGVDLGYDTGGIVHRLKLATPTLAPTEGWPKKKPKVDQAAKDRERKQQADEAIATKVIKDGRAAKKSDEAIKADLAAAGLEWPK